MGRVCSSDAKTKQIAVHRQDSKEVNPKLLEEKEDVKLIDLSKEKIQTIFSEQLRRLPTERIEKR